MARGQTAPDCAALQQVNAVPGEITSVRTGCAVGHIEHNAAPWLFVTVRLNVPACIPVGKVATIGVFVSETNVSFVLLNGAV